MPTTFDDDAETDLMFARINIFLAIERAQVEEVSSETPTIEEENQ